MRALGRITTTALVIGAAALGGLHATARNIGSTVRTDGTVALPAADRGPGGGDQPGQTSGGAQAAADPAGADQPAQAANPQQEPAADPNQPGQAQPTQPADDGTPVADATDPGTGESGTGPTTVADAGDTGTAADG
ncbi:MAG TPA: hypothetical protein VKB57_27780, partial [Acidimicrobiales bacterium]|nr:hypothetical protein [Acidimicrobiales bacterium]